MNDNSIHKKRKILALVPALTFKRETDESGYTIIIAFTHLTTQDKAVTVRQIIRKKAFTFFS